MIDYHCHILAGIDDGATSNEESLAMAEILSEAGFSEVYCTPHCICGLYETTPTLVRERVAALQWSLDRLGIKLRLRTGMEYPLDEFFLRRAEELLPLGDSRLVLVEAPTQSEFAQILDGITRLIEHGYTPVLAHPERCRHFASPPAGALLSRLFKKISPPATKKDLKTQSPFNILRSLGCLFQGDLGSLTGYYGEQSRTVGETLLNRRAYDCFGSDGHSSLALEHYLPESLRLVREKTGTSVLNSPLRPRK